MDLHFPILLFNGWPGPCTLPINQKSTSMAISRKIPQFKNSLKRKVNLLHNYKLEKLSQTKRFRGLYISSPKGRRYYLPSYSENFRSSSSTKDSLLRMSKLFSLKWQKKQTLKAHYLINSETQWKDLLLMSKKKSKSISDLPTNRDQIIYLQNSLFISFLESRLDITLWKSNLVPSLKMSRQLIRHGFIFVNGKKSTLNSKILRESDLVDIRFPDFDSSHLLNSNSGLSKTLYGELFSAMSNINQKTPPFHLEVHFPSLSFIFVQEPFIKSIYFFFDPQLQNL